MNQPSNFFRDSYHKKCKTLNKILKRNDNPIILNVNFSSRAEPSIFTLILPELFE